MDAGRAAERTERVFCNAINTRSEEGRAYVAEKGGRMSRKKGAQENDEGWRPSHKIQSISSIALDSGVGDSICKSNKVTGLLFCQFV